MIEYSNILSYIGLIIISSITLISILRLYKDIKVKNNKILVKDEKEKEISNFRGKCVSWIITVIITMEKEN